MNNVLLAKALAVLALENNARPEAVARLQERRLRRILRHAWAHSRFYRRHYRAAGLREADLAAVPLRDVPTVDKNIVMENFDELVCDPAVRREELERFVGDAGTRGMKYRGRFAVVSSSGSSGTIGIFVYGPADWATLGALTMNRVGRSPLRPWRPTRLAFVGATEGHFAGISLSREAPKLMYDFLPLSIQAPVPEIVRALNGFQPEMLNGYASGAHLLAQEQLDGRLHIAPRAIICSGDPLTDLTRALVREAFGVEAVNLYASSESISMGVQPSPREDMRLFNDWHVFEIVDDALREVAPGQTGNLIMTNLYNMTQPLIRYEMSDRLTRSEPDTKSSHGFQTIRALSGRKEESLSFVVDGQERTLSPHVLGEFFVPGLEKIQYVHHSSDVLLMRAKVRGSGEAVRDRIHEKMRDILSASGLRGRLRFELQIVDRIDNDVRTGKFKLIERA
jgi:phenylacetate-CoA ligase